MLLAGTDTSSATIEWALSVLLNHPEVLKKARAELDAQVGTDRLIEESDLAHLPYLHSIIQETFRLFPPAPLLVPRETSNDCKIEGYSVPQGTLLLFNAWALHRDPRIWEEPTSFIPERFEGSREVEQWKLMPFGMGRRRCPGVGLGQRVVGVTLGALIQVFDWRRVGEEEVDLEEKMGLTMTKAKPLEAMCKARKTLVAKVMEEASSSA